MDIAFSGEPLGRLCSRQSEMILRWGHPTALLICQRLLELGAAASMRDLQLLPHMELQAVDCEAGGVRVGLAVDSDLKIVFVATAESYVSGCNQTDWENLTTVVIEAIECEPGSEDPS